MIIVAIIIGVLIIALMISSGLMIDSNRGNMKTGIVLGTIITVFCAVEVNIISDSIAKPKPTAMNVYQGKTTIEYKVIDNIKVDSVVIFKNNECGE